jgi:iduronate 2-sulfatase
MSTSLVFLLFLTAAQCLGVTNGKPLNVLLVILDNVRPALRAYGDQTSITPTLDLLANRSTLFSQCHTQFPWCAPSRNSFLTGRRPDQTLSWNFLDSFREVGPSWVTLPGYFRQHSYYTTSTGKVFHPNLPPSYDTALSWSDSPFSPSKPPCPQATMSCPLGAGELDVDGAAATEMVRRLSTRANASQPFFAALGLQGGRLPWVYPPAAAAGYPPTLPLPNITDASSLSHLEYYRPTEIDQYSDIKNVSFSHPMAAPLQQRARRAYYAALTNADEALAKVLGYLDTAGLTGSTVVAVMADHGQNLGELNLWSMMNLLDVSTQVPLLIHTPSLPIQAPIYAAPVELVDVFPTLASLAGLPPPPPWFSLDGVDLSPALPPLPTPPQPKDAAI